MRCDGELATVALAWKLKELVPDLVGLKKTPKHDNQANPVETDIRTLEEHVRVMRLDFEHRSGFALRADSCLWP